MTPLFDKDCNLMGWMEPGKYIFDTGMNWVAFIDGDNVWSAETGNWLGQVYGRNIRDTQGKTVFWNPDQDIENTLPPLPPVRPLRPQQPLQPLTPLEGWSELGWIEFLSQ